MGQALGKLLNWVVLAWDLSWVKMLARAGIIWRFEWLGDLLPDGSLTRLLGWALFKAASQASWHGNILASEQASDPGERERSCEVSYGLAFNVCNSCPILLVTTSALFSAEGTTEGHEHQELEIMGTPITGLSGWKGFTLLAINVWGLHLICAPNHKKYQQNSPNRATT